MSKIISRATIKIMKEPATAKEEMSTLNRLRKASPTKKNMKNIIKASRAALAAFIFLPRFFKVKITGMEPVMSITANKTTNALTNSCH